MMDGTMSRVRSKNDPRAAAVDRMKLVSKLSQREQPAQAPEAPKAPEIVPNAREELAARQAKGPARKRPLLAR